jgi:hypothetical protein|tara:strand:+ start:672 stop:890 length:219 start_codon:yes stop_codon:yes gene_type:complete
MAEKFSPPASDDEIRKITASPAGRSIRADLKANQKSFEEYWAKTPAIGPTAIRKKREQIVAGRKKFKALGID